MNNLVKLAGQSFKISGDNEMAYNKVRSIYLTKYVEIWSELWEAITRARYYIHSCTQVNAAEELFQQAQQLSGNSHFPQAHGAILRGFGIQRMLEDSICPSSMLQKIIWGPGGSQVAATVLDTPSKPLRFPLCRENVRKN